MTAWPLCLNTSTIRPASLLEKIALAAATGYAAVELWNDELTRFEEQGGALSELKQRVENAGLKVPSIIALSDWICSDGAQKDAAFAEARRRMEQATRLGAPHIVASPWPDTENLDMSRAAARYRELLDLGSKLGVTPAMEFLGFTRSVYQLEQAVAIAQQAGHPDACIVLDPFHLYRGGSGFGGVKFLRGTNIAICHFNDSPFDPPRFAQSDADRVYPGDGILPLKEMLRDLEALGYKGYLSIELFNPNYWRQDLKEVARLAREKTELIMASIGA